MKNQNVLSLLVSAVIDIILALTLIICFFGFIFSKINTMDFSKSVYYCADSLREQIFNSFFILSALFSLAIIIFTGEYFFGSGIHKIVLLKLSVICLVSLIIARGAEKEKKEEKEVTKERTYIIYTDAGTRGLHFYLLQ